MYRQGRRSRHLADRAGLPFEFCRKGVRAFGARAAATGPRRKKRPIIVDFDPHRHRTPTAAVQGGVVLTSDGALQARIAHPRHKLAKTYFAEVEGTPSAAMLATLARGVDLGDFVTAPARVREAPPPDWLWPRDPPVRFRKSVPTAWLELAIAEGRNRQVRRMTAAVGLPTLRLIRWSVGPWTLAGLAPGAWRIDSADALPNFAPRRR